MMFKKRILAASIAAILPCHFAHAGAAAEPQVVLVSAPKLAAPAEIAVGGDSAGLLRNVPGMSLYGAGGVSSLPAMHGLADDRLRIQVDGMDLISACANHMNPPLSYIDPSAVGAVDVIGGIVPVSAGGDSIGATIRVESKAPQFAAPGQRLLKGQAGAFYRGNGNARGANLSATAASDTFSATYTGASVESGNYKAGAAFKPAGVVPGTNSHLAGDEVGSTRYQAINQSLALALRDADHLLELKLGLQHIPYQDYPNQRMDMTDNQSEQANLSYKGRYEWGVLSGRAYHEHTRHQMNFGADKLFWYGAAANVPGMPMDTEGHNGGAQIKADIAVSARDTLRVGADYQRYRLDDWWAPSGGGMAPNTFWNIRDGKRDRFDLFAEWEANWNAQWLSLIGLRAASVDMNTGPVQGYNNTMGNYLADSSAFNARDRARRDRNLDLSALTRYTPGAGSAYEFGYSRKTRSPNLYERYSWSTGGMAMNMINFAGDGNGYVGDPGLRPEVAHTLSATADWHDAERDSWGVKVTPYYSYVRDYVDARCLGGCGPAKFVFLRFANQNARLYGIDVAGRLPLARSAEYGSLTGSAVLAYVNGKNVTSGGRLYNIMPLNAKLALEHSAGGWTNTAELQVVDAKNEVSEVRNELKTGGYSLFNLRSSYAWKRTRIDVGVENLFDRFYNYPLGGAYVGQGRTMSQTGVPYGVPVPGAGRSVHAGVTVKF
ncbi:MAG: TonB-dependent receptor plug domain-containing protein [Burkholderiaceae bacterium]|nr:TonB-dependent receptor plug domain-containing protein [Burkholderiaceae bacterium]